MPYASLHPALSKHRGDSLKDGCSIIHLLLRHCGNPKGEEASRDQQAQMADEACGLYEHPVAGRPVN